MKMDIQTIVTELKLDRSNWSLTTFGEVAIQQKGSVDRENTDITRYVKGEHMNSEDLHLREWGELKDEYLGPAFIRKFDEGDILYGSRRTYLRKVCVAPFTGITANTTFVIKANEDLIDKRLLPFVMLSEGFSEHSIRNSKGSVNPYVNWKDLADYEFLLPSKDQQSQLTEFLLAMNEVIESNARLLACQSALLESLIADNLISESKDGTLSDYCTKEGIKIGPFGSLLHVKDYTPDGIPVVMPANIENGEISEKNIVRISPEKAQELKNYRLKENDILFPRRGDLTKRAIVLKHQENWICGTGTIRVRLNDLIDPILVFHAVTSSYINHWLLGSSVGTTMPNLNAGSIKKIPFKIPEDVSATEMLRKIESVTTAINKGKELVASSKSIQKSLINQVF